jgi:hypothetical protein
MNTWVFGWPVSLLVPVLGLFRALGGGFVPWLLGLSLLQLGGYAFLAFGSVHDFGTAYQVWHVPILAVVTMSVFAHARRLTARVGPIAFSMTLVSLLVFWPIQLEKWRATAAATLAPVQAAERAAQGRPVFVLWRSVKTEGVGSWVHYPPSPFPENRIIWVQDVPGAAETLGRLYPERAVLRLVWLGAVPAVIAATP